MVWYMFFQEPKASLTSLCDMWRIRCEFCRKCHSRFVEGEATQAMQPSEPALHPFGAGVYQLKSPVTPDWSPQIWLEDKSVHFMCADYPDWLMFTQKACQECKHHLLCKVIPEQKLVLPTFRGSGSNRSSAAVPISHRL